MSIFARNCKGQISNAKRGGKRLKHRSGKKKLKMRMIYFWIHPRKRRNKVNKREKRKFKVIK